MHRLVQSRTRPGMGMPRLVRQVVFISIVVLSQMFDVILVCIATPLPLYAHTNTNLWHIAVHFWYFRISCDDSRRGRKDDHRCCHDLYHCSCSYAHVWVSTVLPRSTLFRRLPVDDTRFVRSGHRPAVARTLPSALSSATVSFLVYYQLYPPPYGFHSIGFIAASSFVLGASMLLILHFQGGVAVRRRAPVRVVFRLNGVRNT